MRLLGLYGLVSGVMRPDVPDLLGHVVQESRKSLPPRREVRGLHEA